jgi:hypothetical protein
MSKEYDEYERLARAGALPADFDQWDLADADGMTVAQVAAMYGHLPADFDQWGLANGNGWTVAHSTARWSHLPAHFGQWDLTDRDGQAVAHVAARHGFLPVSFSQWSLVDNGGLTVLGQLLSNITRLDKYVARWEKERPLCKTDVDWMVFKKELPEIYQKYSISECMLDTDNDQEALQEALRGALL